MSFGPDNTAANTGDFSLSSGVGGSLADIDFTQTVSELIKDLQQDQGQSKVLQVEGGSIRLSEHKGSLLIHFRPSAEAAAHYGVVAESRGLSYLINPLAMPTDYGIDSAEHFNHIMYQLKTAHDSKAQMSSAEENNCLDTLQRAMQHDHRGFNVSLGTVRMRTDEASDQITIDLHIPPPLHASSKTSIRNGEWVLSREQLDCKPHELNQLGSARLVAVILSCQEALEHKKA